MVLFRNKRAGFVPAGPQSYGSCGAADDPTQERWGRTKTRSNRNGNAFPFPEPASDDGCRLEQGCGRALPSGYSGALHVNPLGNLLVFASKIWK